MLNFFKRFGTIYKKTSLVLGVLIPIICYLLLPDASILEDPLSRFGIESKTQTIWIVFNQLMSIAILAIGAKANEKFKDIKTKRILDSLLVFSGMTFALSGMITMDMHIPHLTLAALFFLSYCAYMFWYGFFKRHERITTSVISTILVIFPALAIAITPFMGISYAMFEIVFIASVVIWNYLIITDKLK